MVFDYRQLKEEKFRVRITVGGDILNYHLDAGSPAADLIETKLMLNSVIYSSRKGARFMSLDIKNHFLATPMNNPEFMRVKYSHITADIIRRYSIDLLVTEDEWVYIKTQKGMPVLRQEAKLAYK